MLRLSKPSLRSSPTLLSRGARCTRKVAVFRVSQKISLDECSVQGHAAVELSGFPASPPKSLPSSYSS